MRKEGGGMRRAAPSGAALLPSESGLGRVGQRQGGGADPRHEAGFRRALRDADDGLQSLVPVAGATGELVALGLPAPQGRTVQLR
eukprot:9884933-Alexandrium_andersonii.AAC.1